MTKNTVIYEIAFIDRDGNEVTTAFDTKKMTEEAIGILEEDDVTVVKYGSREKRQPEMKGYVLEINGQLYFIDSIVFSPMLGNMVPHMTLLMLDWRWNTELTANYKVGGERINNDYDPANHRLVKNRMRFKIESLFDSDSWKLYLLNQDNELIEI